MVDMICQLMLEYNISIYYSTTLWGYLGKGLSDIDLLISCKTQELHQLALLMFKVKNKMLPNHLTEIFANANSIHTHNTRNSEFNLALPEQKTNNMKKAFAYRGAEAWNNLSTATISSKSISSFKTKMKRIY